MFTSYCGYPFRNYRFESKRSVMYDLESWAWDKGGYNPELA